MNPQGKIDAFVTELRALVEKHYGQLPPEEVEPFGMIVRTALPIVSDTLTIGPSLPPFSTVTTTVTISLPFDRDPADSDD